jgi:hypothetical protein
MVVGLGGLVPIIGNSIVEVMCRDLFYNPDYHFLVFLLVTILFSAM